ncbi:LysR substrate-binding domain-containing protein [Streptomyces rhizosphaericola]|uniref:LysR substrate-binding domain-containing protein n=1 Tax=Streptomyces rhizosphaericola TaxID=2564098 RepID=UPI0039F14B9B
MGADVREDPAAGTRRCGHGRRGVADRRVPRRGRISRAPGEAEGDRAVLSMVSRGLGVAIMPGLSLYGAPDGIEITALGPGRPTRSIGCLTTSEQARFLAMRVLVREVRTASGIAAVSDSRKSD